mgnify:CR=1 FL=1
MNDRQIACFLEAVKERNFTKVAEKIVSDTAGGQQNDRYAGEGIKYKAVCAFRT